MKKLKSLLALLMAVLMVLSLAACDDGGEKDPTDPPAQPAADGETLETALWKLTYDSAVWVYDEEEFSNEEEYSKIILTIPDGEDGYVINAEISASVEDAEDFRDYLDSYGFDQYEYAVNNAYEFTSIGKVDCLKQEGNYWGDPCLRYFARNEGAGVTVFIEIIGEYEDERVDTLLAGLEFTLEDVGNVDFPWHWDGEAFSAEDKSAMAGTTTVNSKWVAFDEPLIVKDTFDHDVAVAGNAAYIVSEGMIKQYAFDGSTLKFEKDLEIDGDYSYINATDDGSVWASGFGEDLLCIKNGAVVASYEDTDYVTMHPSGAWGISWFSSFECEKITISGGTITAEAITFAEVDTVSAVIIDKDYIYVTGSAVDESGHKVFVYNKDGALQKTLADADGEGLGSITFMAQTSDGFIGMDGNMREVLLWKADGTYVGALEDADLFGTDYPWFCNSAMLGDGSILTVMTEDRTDQSATELVAFVLSGF